MLQQDLMLVFFFLLSASRYSKQQPQVGQKLQKADSLKTREEPDKMGYHSKCNKMYFIFFESRWNGRKKITTDFRHFLGHHIAQNTGQSSSISIPWGRGSLYREIIYIPLDYKPRWKHGVNRILQRVQWSSQEVHCTAHKLESIQGKLLAGNRPGSNTQTWLFLLCSIRYPWLIWLNSQTGPLENILKCT